MDTWRLLGYFAGRVCSRAAVLTVISGLDSQTRLMGHFLLLYSWGFSRCSAPVDWLVHSHITSCNETVSRQMPWASNIAKTMTSNGKQFFISPIVFVETHTSIYFYCLNYENWRQRGHKMFMRVSQINNLSLFWFLNLNSEALMLGFRTVLISVKSPVTLFAVKNRYQCSSRWNPTVLSPEPQREGFQSVCHFFYQDDDEEDDFANNNHRDRSRNSSFGKSSLLRLSFSSLTEFFS